MSVEVKPAVTVSEMARMCGLSRARFYQFIGTSLPIPCLLGVYKASIF